MNKICRVRISRVLPGLVFLLSAVAAAQTVVRVTGDSVQLSVGSRQGVRIGLRGFVHASDTAGGRTVEVKIARFEVTGVSETRAVARILERSAGYSVAAGQRISFVERPSSAAAKPPSAKRPPAANPQIEMALWNAVSAEKSIAGYEEYLAKFPQGTFSGVARRGIEQLRAAEHAAAEEAEQKILARVAAEKRAEEQVERKKRLDALVLPNWEFVRIPAGEFVMGAEGGYDAHRVRITKSFELGKYEVTQAQWESVMGSNPSGFKGAERPVEQVSWNDAQEFLGKLNGRSDGYRYRLPTEAEWEYAALAGAATDDPGSVDEVAWYSNNSDQQTHPVGRKRANAWGVHDMLGNVSEWCQDWYEKEYYRTSPAEDPQGPSSGELRVVRGGHWRWGAKSISMVYRSGRDSGDRNSFHGFRCVRERIR